MFHSVPSYFRGGDPYGTRKTIRSFGWLGRASQTSTIGDEAAAACGQASAHCNRKTDRASQQAAPVVAPRDRHCRRRRVDTRAERRCGGWTPRATRARRLGRRVLTAAERLVQGERR